MTYMKEGTIALFTPYGRQGTLDVVDSLQSMQKDVKRWLERQKKLNNRFT